PVILQPLSATSRFMMVGISSDKVEPTELSLLARWTIKPKLLGVPGVANVAIWGQRLRQLQVQIDPQRLRDARVLQDDVIAAAGDALWVSPLTFLKGSAPGTGGWIDNTNQRLGVHHQMPINSPEDMAKVVLGAQHLLMTGKTIALGDVTELTFAHPPLIGDAFGNNGTGLTLGVVIDDAVIDTEKIMRRLEARNDGSDASIAGIVFQTTLETRSASVYAMAIVMLAVTPIFFMGGVSGAFFEPLALAYLLAVAA